MHMHVHESHSRGKITQEDIQPGLTRFWESAAAPKTLACKGSVLAAAGQCMAVAASTAAPLGLQPLARGGATLLCRGGPDAHRERQAASGRRLLGCAKHAAARGPSSKCRWGAKRLLRWLLWLAAKSRTKRLLLRLLLAKPEAARRRLRLRSAKPKRRRLLRLLLLGLLLLRGCCKTEHGGLLRGRGTKLRLLRRGLLLLAKAKASSHRLLLLLLRWRLLLLAKRKAPSHPRLLLPSRRPKASRCTELRRRRRGRRSAKIECRRGGRGRSGGCRRCGAERECSRRAA